MISTNNKIRNENPASTGSLAGSKRFFSTFHLSSTRTNQRTCCINLDMSRLMQQVRDQIFDNKSRKRVESMLKACRKPARTCRKPGCKPSRKPCLQLARIMECGLYCGTPVRHDAVCVNNIIMVQRAVRVNSVRYKRSRCLFLVSASSRHVMQ